MSFSSRLKSAVAGITAGALLFSSASALPEKQKVEANAASVCTVNTNKTYQYIRGFGGIDLPEWQGYSLSSSELARAFGNGDGQLGLTVLRVYVNPDSSQWSRALSTAQYASKAGATVFATPWEPPSSLCESGGSNGKLHLKTSSYADYAKHLNDFGTYMKNNGVDLYSISVQNEPDYASEWTYWSPTEATNFIADYGDQITSTRLMSPETFQYGAWSENGRNFYNYILNNAKALANTDVFGTHFYGTPRSKMDFPALENSGREIWMTEVYVPNSDANSANNWPEALDVAENIHNGLVVGNMSVYTWWYIKRSYSLLEQSGSDGAITKRGYMMAQYSKYVRPGDLRIDATESPQSDVYISAYKHSDTQIEIVAVNKGSDYAQEFSISGRTIKNVDRYRTSANENLAATKGMDHDTSSFFAQLPANSVSTFVITLESDGVAVPEMPDGPTEPEPEKPLEPDANGYYIHDTFEDGTDDWTGRGSATVTLSGKDPYADKEALLVQDRASAWNGTQKA
ncbi:MAG: glucuronoarabinoxylan endo-1,4-beta-xylanase, partial [Ruminococcus sp.]|nr:glucuronoarabinoxylan endo-1,4-beta-xylanase [Ruminococcus sp.]